MTVMPGDVAKTPNFEPAEKAISADPATYRQLYQNTLPANFGTDVIDKARGDGLLTQAIANHVKSHWATYMNGYFPGVTHVGEIIQRGMYFAAKLAEDYDVPLCIQWICTYPKGSDQFQAVNMLSDNQVTLSFMTPVPSLGLAVPTGQAYQPLWITRADKYQAEMYEDMVDDWENTVTIRPLA